MRRYRYISNEGIDLIYDDRYTRIMLTRRAWPNTSEWFIMNTWPWKAGVDFYSLNGVVR